MSSILKALRKLEEEKSSTREGSLDIGRDILRLPARRRRRRSFLLPALAALLIVAAGGIGGYLHDGKPAPESSAPMPSAVQTSTPSAPVRPAGTELPAPAAEKRPLPADEVIVEERIDNPRIPQYPDSLRAPRKKAPSAAKSVKAASPETRPGLPPVPPIPSPSFARAANDPDRSAFRLTGIAYQDDPEARVAVVNNLPVMKGTVIDGGVVEEILSDRVRIRLDGGRILEIAL